MPGEGVNHNVDGAVLDDVHDVGAALTGLGHGGDGKAEGADHIGGALGGIQLVGEGGEHPDDVQGLGLVPVGDAQKDPAPRGEHHVAGEEGLGKGRAEGVVDAHDLSGGLHLGAEESVYADEL